MMSQVSFQVETEILSDQGEESDESQERSITETEQDAESRPWGGRKSRKRKNDGIDSTVSDESSEDDEEERTPCSRCKLRETLEGIVLGSKFDTLSGVLVVLNAISMGVQTDYMARTVSEYPPQSLRYVETAFCCAFTVELAARLFVHQGRFFTMQGYRWNLFDLIVVSLQVIEEAFVMLASSIGPSGQLSNFSFIRVLRILRLIRVVRVVRVLRLIRELRTIVMSIMTSLRSLFWTVVLLNLIIYVTSMYLTQVVLNFRVHNEDPELDAVLRQHFGSLTSTVQRLYQSISGGVDWGALVEPLTRNISPALGVFYSCYVAFITLAMLNVVTGVFVESVVENAKEDRDVYLMNLVKKLFFTTVRDNSGMVSWKEFELHLDDRYMLEFFDAIEVDKTDAKAVFKLLDIDGTGMLDFDEFLNGCLRLRGPARALDMAALIHDTARSQRKHFVLAHQVETRLKEVLDANARICRTLEEFAPQVF